MKPRNHEIFAYRNGDFENIRPEAKEFLDKQAAQIADEDLPEIKESKENPILLIEEVSDKED